MKADRATVHWREPLPLPETIPAGEMWVDVLTRPDGFGRQTFFVYWPEDRRWLGGGLVAGQIHVGRLDEFAARVAELDRMAVKLAEQGYDWGNTDTRIVMMRDA